MEQGLSSIKTCTKCQLPKADSEFSTRGDGDGLKPQCKDCLRARVRKWRGANPEKVAVSDRKANLKKLYDISLEEYNTMLAAQGGVCAICGGPPRGVGSRTGVFHVDHDHVTGAVRGLLCGPCNSGIAYLGENPDTVDTAAAYLRGLRKQFPSNDRPEHPSQSGHPQTPSSGTVPRARLPCSTMSSGRRSAATARRGRSRRREPCGSGG